ncbi:hypothetical protein EGR_08761 [Echinococcus granulosus]|uniref:Uncharacterized protein n=1 Tax=Echinococcus granulosus TaxID=6210 RepID=W6U7Q9_ECHGR|nr:hypothetical protein EGR_08761 [Echinococcus granulosus]EUB56391.1 hypothetical protein EGR_08761 [Echinococcus granulosus]
MDGLLELPTVQIVSGEFYGCDYSIAITVTSALGSKVEDGEEEEKDDTGGGRRRRRRNKANSPGTWTVQLGEEERGEEVEVEEARTTTTCSSQWEKTFQSPQIFTTPAAPAILRQCPLAVAILHIPLQNQLHVLGKELLLGIKKGKGIMEFQNLPSREARNAAALPVT